MARKFIQAQGRVVPVDPDLPAYNAFRKEHYFFYGSLTEPATVAKILDLRDRPSLVPAQVVGYSCKFWGRHPALLDGPAGAVVCGRAYVVETSCDRDRLEEYGTDNYRLVPCLIRLQDGSQVQGSTFLWNECQTGLREGAFNLEDCQMDKMGSCSSESSPPVKQTKR